jgi:7-carboxy-7-deazaguanine synthase
MTTIPNDQKPEQFNRSLDALDVQDIFDTIQGEGPFAGCQATFLRLAGCNLQCPLCDTDYTSNRETLLVSDLVRVMVERRPSLVVVTGGEPFRQEAVSPLVYALVNVGKWVQIETNGVFCPNDIASLAMNSTIVISPKTSKVSDALAQRADAWKYVLSHDAVSPEDGLPTSVLGMQGIPARPPLGDKVGVEQICLQPADHQDEEINRKNLDAVLESCNRFGYRLCLQLHKIVGLP